MSLVCSGTYVRGLHPDSGSVSGSDSDSGSVSGSGPGPEARAGYRVRR